MPPKASAKKGSPSPIQSQKQELERRAQRLQEELRRTQEFLNKAPELIAQKQRDEHRARMARYEQPPRLDHPGNFRLELIAKPKTKPPKLRRERSFAPFVTVLLLVAFVVVFYHGWRVLWQG